MYQYPQAPQENNYNQIQQPILYDQQQVQYQYSDHNMSNNSDTSGPMLEHINYVKTKFMQYAMVSTRKLSPDTHPNHPEFYNFNVQGNLPFRIDVDRIEGLYDATKPDVYRRAFLEPIAEDNQFQGWSESRLSGHPFMCCIQDLCSQLTPKIERRIYLCWLILALMQIINIVIMVDILQVKGNVFPKILAIFLGGLNLILFIFWGLQIARILRGFGSTKKLVMFFIAIWVVQMIYTPVVFVVNPSQGFWPFLLAFFEIIFLIGFGMLNKRQILVNSQIYILVNGKQKLAY